MCLSGSRTQGLPLGAHEHIAAVQGGDVQLHDDYAEVAHELFWIDISLGFDGRWPSRKENLPPDAVRAL